MIDVPLWRLRWRKLVWVIRQRERISLLRHRAAPSLEHTELFASRHYGTVIDIGANVGQFALFALACLRPSQLVCVEPQPTGLDYLRHLNLRGGCSIDVLAMAFSDVEGTQSLWLTRAADSSSLLAPAEGATDRHRGLGVISQIEVPVTAGDTVLHDDYPGPVLLKIDVQGSELPVLNGLSRTLSQVDTVLVEVSFSWLYEGQSHPQEVVDLLSASGFHLSGLASVPGGTAGWRLEQADLLFDRVAAE